MSLVNIFTCHANIKLGQGSVYHCVPRAWYRAGAKYLLSEKMSLVYGSSYKRSGSKMAENFVSSRDSITNVNANWMKSSNGF